MTINKHKIKKSQFAILDNDPQTIAKNIKDVSEGVKTLEDINKKSNKKNQEAENSNNIVVHTIEDNLVHNYFHYFDLYWDAGDPMSSVVLRLPKTEAKNTKYWITYTGEVEVYIGADIDKERQQTTNEENNTQSSTEYWNMQGMKALFRGDIGNIKEYKDVLEIHIDSIGKRFKQKIPDEFRQSFINNQNVRDAFQAICEFLGVKYICPPPTAAPEDEALATESTDKDGTENNVTDAANAEKAMADKASQAAAQAIASNSGSSSTTNNSSNPSGSTNPDDPNASTDTTNQALTEAETDTPQNGYGDISFDASGAIVHGSAVIETSPDMAETLIAMEEHPLTKYTEDTTYVAADIKKFLSGEFFETVHGNYLDYDAVTIEPKAASSSDMAGVGGVGGADGTGADGTNGANGDPNSRYDAQVGATIGALNGWYNGQLYSGGKIVLWKEYIRTLSPSEALAKYQSGQNTYTSDTLQKLLWRSMGSMLL